VLLKEALVRFPKLRLIVMSATLSNAQFGRYFADVNKAPGTLVLSYHACRLTRVHRSADPARR
jgi:hypothetical protein